MKEKVANLAIELGEITAKYSSEYIAKNVAIAMMEDKDDTMNALLDVSVLQGRVEELGKVIDKLFAILEEEK